MLLIYNDIITHNITGLPTVISSQQALTTIGKALQWQLLKPYLNSPNLTIHSHPVTVS